MRGLEFTVSSGTRGSPQILAMACCDLENEIDFGQGCVAGKGMGLK